MASENVVATLNKILLILDKVIDFALEMLAKFQK